MKRTYLDITNRYYDNLDKIIDGSEEIDLKIWDQGNWISIESFMEGRI